MTRQHALIVGALIILLFIIGLPFVGDEEPEETEPQVQRQEIPDVPPPEPEPQPAPDPEPEPVPEPVPEAEEVAEEPEPAPQPEPSEPAPEPEPAIPPLNDSDTFVAEQLQELDPDTPVADFLASSQLVRKGVMLVDNMSRGEVPPRDRPLQGPDEEIRVRQIGEERWVMEESSYRRFDPIVNAFVDIDTEQLLALYDRSKPLLEEAYAELGYPDREFGDTLLQAITRVLNTSVPEGPFELTLPSVHYEFADERLESLSRVEKLMIRMGPENAARVKEKLQEVRQALLARRRQE